MARATKHNHLVTDEKIKQFNPMNVELLDEFIIYLQSTGKSEGTVKGYKNDIEIFFTYSLDNLKNKAFVDLTKRDVMFYQNFCVNKLNLSSARYRRMRSALSSMANYTENMLDDMYPTFKNIINKIECPPKSPVREKSIFEPDELQGVLDYLVENEEYQRACALSLAMATGNRKTELLRFKMSYFVDDNIKYGAWWKTHEQVKIKGRGDKRKPRYILISQFKPYLELWKAEREKLGIDSEWLFVTKKSDTYSQAHVGFMDYCAEMFSNFLGRDFYFHSMRHYFTTLLSKSGIPPEIIKDIISWESLDMVSIYNDQDVDDKLGEYFDETGIKKVDKKALSEL